MNKMHVTLAVIVSLIIGGLIGSFGYSKTAAKYDAISTACVIANEAVDKELLTVEQVRELGALAGTKMKKDMSSVASRFAVSPDILKDASKESNCSQFLVGFNSVK
ncbi:hypothetical protein [Acinetobacter sp. A47]|uniref:hypothetical protein n=1 Tax=Acinetobacter sp. A47 TaxID=1561217 RepID=UPI0005710C9C|nr:hypothetical protein [Acinetobacter sp. A47]